MIKNFCTSIKNMCILVVMSNGKVNRLNVLLVIFSILVVVGGLTV